MSWYGIPAGDLVAAVLLETGAVQVRADRPFTLTSGKLSPIYFDCRRLISNPAAMTLITGSFQWFVDRCDVNFQIVAGGESAGIPFADRLAGTTGKPLVYVRKQAREHGTGSAIEGHAVPGAHALLVEDLITDGGSKLVFVDGLRKAEMQVEHCLVVLDREQGGADVLGTAGVVLHALTTARKVLDFACHTERLSESDVAVALDYLKAPEAWVNPNTVLDHSCGKG
ncbi:MAG: orotate phosphoribosyltransferase [Thermoguttaceae bacterium]